jgi:hypothetical protein
MYPVINQNPTVPSFWDQFYELSGTIESKIPTFEKSLDVYFDKNFAAVIEEWNLLTDSDLARLENRFASISNEISLLYAGKTSVEMRVKKLEGLITDLEKSV